MTTPTLPGADSNPMAAAAGRVDIDERPAWSMGGAPGLLLIVVLFIVSTIAIVVGADDDAPGLVLIGSVLLLIACLAATGLAMVSPGDTRVVQFFGAYIGTVRRTGLVLKAPLSSSKKVSIKVNNFETHELKVNDAEGNPINIAAIVVWQVADTAKSVFAVEDAHEFVAVQSESALRHIAGGHPYDNGQPGVETLRGATEKVADELAAEVAARISIAGLEVIEARISSLAYAPEIAQAMLQRQQASAVIAAREKIVEGAVTMVQNALTQLEEQDIVSLDNERKAAMVSNLLVVLCSDSHATPVVNAGSLYN